MCLGGYKDREIDPHRKCQGEAKDKQGMERGMNKVNSV